MKNLILLIILFSLTACCFSNNNKAPEPKFKAGQKVKIKKGFYSNSQSYIVNELRIFWRCETTGEQEWIYGGTVNFSEGNIISITNVGACESDLE